MLAIGAEDHASHGSGVAKRDNSRLNGLLCFGLVVAYG
jgi:hypothetical protein